jgi:hypothetical protein
MGTVFDAMRFCWRTFIGEPNYDELADEMSPAQRKKVLHTPKKPPKWRPSKSFWERNAACWRCDEVFDRRGMNKVPGHEEEYICRKCDRIIKVYKKHIIGNEDGFIGWDPDMWVILWGILLILTLCIVGREFLLNMFGLR